MALMTPAMVKALPQVACRLMRSPSRQKPSSAPNMAWVANSTPERLGPSRFMAANRAVSPTKMPIRPLRAITLQDAS